MIKKILFLWILITALIGPKIIFAFDFPYPKPSAIPGTNKYRLQRGWEKLYQSFLFSNKSSLRYNEKLFKKRMSELIYVVENKQLSQIEQSSQRFSYQAGIIAEILVYEEDDKFKEEVMNIFKEYSPYLEKLRDEFPANSSNWLLIQQDIDTLNILASKFNNN